MVMSLSALVVVALLPWSAGRGRAARTGDVDLLIERAMHLVTLP
jgi:hypothetical protein